MTSPLIDVHAHFVTPRYLDEAARAGHELPDGMPWWPSWIADDHLRLMDRIGVQRAILSISSPGVHFGDDAAACDLARHVNDFAAEVVAQHPDRFSFFASVPLPDVEASIKEAHRGVTELGALGVCLMTNSSGVYPSDPALDGFWQELDLLRTVAFLHPTSPPGWEGFSLDLPRPLMEFAFETTRAVTGLLLTGTLHRNPGVRLVVPHSGAALPALVDRATMFQTVGRAFLPEDHPGKSVPDAADALADLWFDSAGTPTPTALGHLVDKVGTDHLLYGSDFCFTPEHGVLGQVAALDAATDGLNDWRAVMSRNAKALLSPAALG